MFCFTTGTGACLALFDFARGLLARSNSESFAPLFWRRCQCELSVLLLLNGFLPYCLRTSSRKKGAVSPTLSAFKLRAERRETCPTLSAFQTSGIPGNVFGRRSTVLLQREVFVNLNDDGQAPESVLFLPFGQKRFMETFPPPSILRFRFGFGFTGFRSRLFTHFSWHAVFRYAPTPPRTKSITWNMRRDWLVFNWSRDRLHTFYSEKSGACYQRFSPLGANAARFLPLGGLFRKPLGPGYTPGNPTDHFQISPAASPEIY